MKRLIVSFTALLVLACARSSGAPVSFSVGTAKTATASRALVVAGTIDVQRVRLNVGRLKLEGQGSSTGFDGEHDDGEDGGMADGGTGQVGEVDISQGPFLIDLDATALSAGAVTKVFDAQVPAGTYQELRLEIFPSAALKDASLKDASVIVDGTIGTKSFSFSSALLAKQKKEGSFVVGGTTANITLLIDPQQWFGTAAAPLDPTVETNRAAIEENIRRSIDVFQDDDHSGHENHDGDHDDGEHRDGGHADGGHG
jgi:hypothetical protein